jgi:hypothetical protein
MSEQFTQSYGTKRLYQYGGYIFREANILNDLSTSVKTQQSNTVLIDGSIRLNGIDRNTVEDQTMTVSFLLKEGDNIDAIQYEFFREPQKVFFIHYSREGEIKILFNYAECLSLKDHGFDSRDSLNNKLTATFRFMTPFLYQCLDNLYLLDSKQYPAGDRNFWGDGHTKWADGTIWGNTDKLGINIKYENQTFDIMDKYFGCNCDFGYPLYYFDAYFKKETTLPTSVNISETKNLATAPINFQTKGSKLKLDGGFENNIVLLKLVVNLHAGDWVDLYNQDNNSSVRLTWLDSSPSGSPNIALSLYDFELYNVTAGNVQITDVSRYRIDINSEDALFFKSHYPHFLDPYFPVNERIKITTGNGSNSTVIPGTITIYNLPTYII